MQAEDAAKALVKERFADCRTAILGGSVVRGEATARSDLDIVVIDDRHDASYRESLYAYGWPVELFVHNSTSYRDFFESDCKEGTPSMPKMCSEGIVIKDDGFADQLKKEARDLLEKGPEPWTETDILMKRYGISDLLDDLEGSDERGEDLFTANALAYSLHEFILRMNGCWIGGAKWIPRALKRYDEELCYRFVEVFDHFYITRNKEKLIAFADEILTPYGGRLFDGFSLGTHD
ncbi:MAG TPA: nucleotidyltransferase domain-containing protein [Bacillales bacterium]|nr:nucleotidyltransferase domain-containing protein [Bacillales bacterium]